MDEKEEDVGIFDPNIPEEGPSAPPPGWLDDIHGYQGLKGGDDDNPLYPPPPAYNPQPEQNRSTSVPDVRVPSVSEDVARDALLKFVESKWNYSSKPARNLTFKDLQPITVYRYRLETYTETRASAWQFEPYNGIFLRWWSNFPILIPVLEADRVPLTVLSSWEKFSRSDGGRSSVRYEPRAVGHPGVAASEIHRQGGEDPSAALVVREGVSQVQRLRENSLHRLLRPRPEALHVLPRPRSYQEQALHFLSWQRSKEVFELPQPRLQDLLRLSRRPKPAAFHPAHSDVVSKSLKMFPRPSV
ncbi:uncharacterized protein LOC113021793 isoform X3 [Astatotilapia calliptera]|uniref:uncharacterized protein LOC113021793 isoform X3 n=1 Tax=Astatotilapia calliptera TaxID=8154 RepID=UPI000E400CE0|nr:uncharacterized protein LOC113021793 isoform X3 [Astatotilapia calliptera]